MLDRQKGEVFFDIGVTYQPVNDSEKLVGLWRLPALEASYGAGGYLAGSLHTINTLSHYGALQAEMSGERALRMHISFRSSYLLTHEATRRRHNSRDLFKDKEVFFLTDRFFQDFERIEEIFKEREAKRSYGIRDEFRVGGAALENIAAGIDNSVKYSSKYSLLKIN